MHTAKNYFSSILAEQSAGLQRLQAEKTITSIAVGMMTLRKILLFDGFCDSMTMELDF